MAELTPIVLDCSSEDAKLHRLQRKITDGDFEFHGILPDTDEGYAEVYEKIEQAEQEVVGDNYVLGTAAEIDDVLTVRGSGRVLLTAEHATDHWTKDSSGLVIPKTGERGTGGLAYLLAGETNNSAVIANGQQRSNATWGEHSVKAAMLEVLAKDINSAHFSIHGLARGLALRPEDYWGYSVMIGVGDGPSNATRTLVWDYLVPGAEEMGLKVGVNQPFISFDPRTDLPRMLNKWHNATKVFKGPPLGTTAYAAQIALEAGKADSYVAAQLELSGAIRYQPNAPHVWPNRQNQQFGAYLGYMFMKLAIESVGKL